MGFFDTPTNKTILNPDPLGLLPKAPARAAQPSSNFFTSEKVTEQKNIEGNFFTGEPTHVPDGLKAGQTFSLNGKTYVVSAPPPRATKEIGADLYSAVNGKPKLSVATGGTDASTGQEVDQTDLQRTLALPGSIVGEGAIQSVLPARIKEPFGGVYQEHGFDTPDSFKSPVGGIFKAAVEMPERITQDVADFFNQAFKGEISDQAVFTDSHRRIVNSFSEANDMYNQQKANGVSDLLAKATATLYGVSSTILDVFPFIEGAARGVLAASSFDKELNSSLYRLGMSPQDFSVETWAKNTRQAAIDISRTGDATAARQLVEDYKTISKSLRVPTTEIGKTSEGLSIYELADQSGMEHANTTGVVKFAQDVSNKILEPLGGKGATYNIARNASESLPGYRPQYDQPFPAGMSAQPLEPVGFENAPLKPSVPSGSAEVFKGFPDITTKILDQLEGKVTVSKIFIQDLTNQGDLKQQERDIIRTALEGEGDKVNVKDFADKVKAELLPLETSVYGSRKLGGTKPAKYEGVTLSESEGLRGSVMNYAERVYTSPIKTSAGNVHFPEETNYFGHTRIEDLADGETRRVNEVQSDLYQKGRLEGAVNPDSDFNNMPFEKTARHNFLEEAALKRKMTPAEAEEYAQLSKEIKAVRGSAKAKLEQYSNPTAHFRMVREEVKQAAIDGKTKLQFPTGETAMKIEGLGNATLWADASDTNHNIQFDELKPGKEIVESRFNGAANEILGAHWIITDVIGDGKFKAVPKSATEKSHFEDDKDLYEETFDISGKVDTSNPIYKFYEKDLGKYLTNKYGAKRITDAQGVTWYEVNIKPDMARQPVTTFTKNLNSANIHTNDTNISAGARGEQPHSEALGDLRRGHGKFGNLLPFLRTQGLAWALRRGYVSESFQRFVDRPRQFGGYFQTHFGREDFRLNPKTTHEEIDAASAALLNMVGKNNYTIDSYVDNMVAIYEAAGMPEITGAEIRKFFSILPDTIKKQFGGIFTADTIETDDKTEILGGIRTNPDTTFDLILNTKFFKDKRFATGAIALHELYGHVTYGYSDIEFKGAVRSGMNDLVVKNSELAKKIFLAGADTDFEGLMRSYYADSVNYLYKKLSVLVKGASKDPTLLDAIFNAAGIHDEAGKPFLQGQTTQHFFLNADLIKDDVLQTLKGSFPQHLTPQIEQILSTQSSSLANEFFARLSEYAGTNGMADLEFLKGTPLYEIASRAAARSTSLFSNSLEKATPEEVLVYALNEPHANLDEKVNQIQTEISILQDTLAADPAKELAKFANTNGELPEVLGFGGKFATSGDEISAVGFSDSEEARQAYGAYRMKQKQLNALKDTLKLAKEALKRTKLAEADENALERFLNKGAKTTEAEQRIERTRQAVLRGERAAENAEAYRQQFNRLIEEMRKKDIEKLTVMGQIKQTIFPLKTIDHETKGILETWQRKLLAGEQLANMQYQDLNIPGVEGVGTFYQYQDGVSNPYYDKIHGIFRSLLHEARARGLEVEDRGPNYLPGVYAETPEEIAKATAQKLADMGMDPDTIVAYMKGDELPPDMQRRLSLHPFFEKAKVFRNYKEAAQYGLTPKFKTVGQLVGYYREQMERTIANQELLDELIQRAKIMPIEIAPPAWQPVNLAFSVKGYYAEDKLAKILNAIFHADREATLGENFWRALANGSKVWQDIALSGGAPKTALNSFSYALALKSFTAALGHIAFLEGPAAIDELKAASAFLRGSALKSQTANYFIKNQDYLLKMAEQGIDLGDYVGSYMNRGVNSSSHDPLWKKLGGQTGEIWDKTMNEKTFNAMLPMMYVDQFKGIYNKLIRKGYNAPDAATVAGDTVKAFNGITNSLGRSRSVQDALTAIFFAPRYRETVLTSLANTGKAGLEMAWNIGGFRKPLTKSLEKNRRLFIGLAIMLGLYELLNRKLNDGKGMLDNEENHKLDLRIPLPSGGAAYIGYMPSLFTLVRAAGNTLFDLSQGDVAGAEQAVGTAFSMPLKTTVEALTNKDYFGRAIYKDTDTGLEKGTKIAEYYGLAISHPFITQLIKYFKTDPEDRSIWQSTSMALEMPLKFSTASQIANNQFYAAMDLKTKQNADEKRKIQPIYNHVKDLYQQGNKDEADVIYNGLSDDDKAVFKNIASAAKSSNTQDEETKIYPTVLKVQKLYKSGDTESASKIYDALTTEEKRVFKLVAAKLPK